MNTRDAVGTGIAVVLSGGPLALRLYAWWSERAARRRAYGGSLAALAERLAAGDTEVLEYAVHRAEAGDLEHATLLVLSLASPAATAQESWTRRVVACVEALGAGAMRVHESLKKEAPRS